MFGIGKILGAFRAVAPFLQLIPPLAPFAAIFNVADRVASLVSDFKNGFSFLDLVSKFAPLPSVFGQNALGSCFGLNSSKISSWQNSFLTSSKEYRAFQEIKNVVNDWHHVNDSRTNTFYNGSYTFGLRS